jgi:hypothetical protein
MIAETSLTPPASDSDRSITSTRQPRRSAIAAVHAEELGGEERRLVAAGAGADLEDDVLAVVRVLRDERLLDLSVERLALSGEARRLGLGQDAQLLVRRGLGRRHHFAGVGELSVDLAQLAEEGDDRVDLGERLADLAHRLGVGVDLRQGEPRGELGVRGFEGQQAVDHRQIRQTRDIRTVTLIAMLESG